jgi:polyphosphate kinase
VDPRTPFPHISNLSLNLLVVIRYAGREVMARIKVPATFERFMKVPPTERPEETPAPGVHEEIRLVRVEEVLQRTWTSSSRVRRSCRVYVFQVTRNADLVIEEDEASDLLQTIEDELAGRWFGQSVRLVVTDSMPAELREWLAENLRVPRTRSTRLRSLWAWGLRGVYAPGPGGLVVLAGHAARSRTRSGAPRRFTSAIREGDILLYHPYDSFAPVVEFVRAAASDPDVLAIKQTLYRVGSNSPIVEALSEARDEQTQVAVLVELKARFDEEPNITWARRLEAQGVHVAYGLVGLKTHAKICLVVRREGGGLRRYVHLGTGNYNPSTARLYTDFSYFTDDPELGEDGTDLFNYLTGYSEQEEYQELLVAPLTMREKFVELVREQAARAEKGEPARISCKMNNLTDPKIIEELYLASQAGVKIEMVIRGICCLKPGLEGISESIRVVSLVGRFLSTHGSTRSGRARTRRFTSVRPT